MIPRFSKNQSGRKSAMMKKNRDDVKTSKSKEVKDLEIFSIKLGQKSDQIDTNQLQNTAGQYDHPLRRFLR